MALYRIGSNLIRAPGGGGGPWRQPDGGGGGGGNVGQVGSYAAMNMQTYPIYSIDMNLGDYFIFATQGIPVQVGTPVGEAGSGDSAHVSSGWPLGGGGYCRINPPTSNGRERGIFVGNLWRTATLAIQELNYRFEWRVSSDFFSYTGDGSKFCIAHSRNSLTVGSSEARAVLFLQQANSADNVAWQRNDTAAFGPAQETVSGWGSTVYGDTWIDSGGTLSYYMNSIQPYYLVNDGDSGTFQGSPKIQASEVITIEHRIITKTSVSGYPRGLLAYRVYRENGSYFERGIPWNWDTGVPFDAYFYELQQFGCGQWNTAPGSNADYCDVGGYITIARDLSVLQPGLGGWLGRRSA